LLVLVVILVVIGNIRTVQANTEQQEIEQRTPMESAQAGSQQNDLTPQAAGENSSPTAPLDNITLAAVIAAENAALTLPQYLTDLPIVNR
jgi:hypothetical protein